MDMDLQAILDAPSSDEDDEADYLHPHASVYRRSSAGPTQAELSGRDAAALGGDGELSGISSSSRTRPPSQDDGARGAMDCTDILRDLMAAKGAGEASAEDVVGE